MTDQDRQQIGMYRINQIVCLNSFPDGATLPSNNVCTLALLPSYINHSCCDANANIWVSKDGEIALVRATQDIETGQEILMSYIDPSIRYVKRTKSIRFRYGRKRAYLIN